MRSPDHQVVRALHVLHDRFIQLVAGHPHAPAEDDAGKRNQGHFRRAAADVDDHVAGRILHRETDADRRGHRFLDQVNLARAGMRGGFADGAFFDFGDARGNRDHHPGTGADAAVVHFRDEMAQHRLGHFEIGDDAVLERSHGNDVGRRAAEHAFRLVADGQHLGSAGLHRYNGRFAQNDTLILDVNEGVGGTEIDPDVTGEPTEKSI